MGFDFGIKRGKKFKELKIPTFEEILKEFGSHTIMNIHVKIWDFDVQDDKIDGIVGLIRKYACERHCYFMSRNDKMLKRAKGKSPLIEVCVW